MNKVISKPLLLFNKYNQKRYIFTTTKPYILKPVLSLQATQNKGYPSPLPSSHQTKYLIGCRLELAYLSLSTHIKHLRDSCEELMKTVYEISMSCFSSYIHS